MLYKVTQDAILKYIAEDHKSNVPKMIPFDLKWPGSEQGNFEPKHWQIAN